ncbi:MAG TPA: penicillin-binding transpeptidase domain-containing protein, partial [Acidimicrobiia bacterium]
MNEANSGRRLAVIGVIVVSLFAGLLTRLWFLQVTGGEKLAVAAQQNREHFKTNDAQRGTIYDATGKILAQNVTKTALVVDRQNLTPAKRITLEKSLAGLLGTDAAGVDKLIDDPKYSPYEPVPVKTDLTADQEQFWAEHQDDFPDVTVARSTVRVYPYRQDAAAHVLGYIGSINADELEVHRSDGYTSHDVIGKTGVEQTFESELRGVPGLEKIEVDSRGNQSEPVVVRKPQAGHDVQLTINIDVQKSAEQSLQQGIDGAMRLVDPDSGTYYRANAGAVIVLDARTGSLVAMASNPTYDPNQLTAGTVSKDFFDPNGSLQLIDRALNPYAPGSTFKTFTSIAMLQSGIRNATDTYDDEGCFKFGNNEERCNARKEKFYSVDLRRALTVSSDVYFYNVGNSFWNVYSKGPGKEGGDDVADHPVGYAMQTVARTYGLGEPTGVGLAGDSPGRIPDL